MGEDYAGQKRQQNMLQYSMALSFAAALTSGCVLHSFRAGCYVYMVGLFFTWLINVVNWDYFLCEPTTWAEGKYLDVTGYWELEARDRVELHLARERMPKQRAQITMSGGPARMTISSKPLPELRYKKW